MGDPSRSDELYNQSIFFVYIDLKSYISRMKDAYTPIYIQREFTFEELHELNREMAMLDDYSLQCVVIDALWKYYPRETYSYLQQSKLTNQYDPIIFKFILGMDYFIERSVKNRYQIHLPEEKLWRNRVNLPDHYVDLITRIRIHNGSLGSFGFNSQADDIVVQLFKDAKAFANQVSSKKIKVDYLGELLWMEAWLIATWDYIKIKKKKFKKMDRYLKLFIFAYADNEKLDELTREKVKRDYSKDAFRILDSWEFRFLQTFDSTLNLSGKLIRRLFGRGKTEKEKKLEKLRKLVESDR